MAIEQFITLAYAGIPLGETVYCIRGSPIGRLQSRDNSLRDSKLSVGLRRRVEVRPEDLIVAGSIAYHSAKRSVGAMAIVAVAIKGCARPAQEFAYLPLPQIFGKLI